MTKKEIKYLDDSKYIPDVEKSFSDSNISVKNVIKSGASDFYVWVGNYIDGLKQGEFKLLKYQTDYSGFDYKELASIKYLNDTIEGDLKFNDYFFNEQNANNGLEYITVLISKNKITDQTIKISDKNDFIIFKNNVLDSGYINNDNDYYSRDYFFKKTNIPGVVDLTFLNSKNGKTLLRVSDGYRFTKRMQKGIRFFKDVEDLNCEGISINNDRYITFSIRNSKLKGFINCYYLNDSLNYSINTSTGQIDLWVDLTIDQGIKIPFSGEYGEIQFKLLEDVISGENFLDDNLNFNIEQIKRGYYKIAEIKNMSFSNGSVFGTKYFLEWSNSNPFSIEYKIHNHIIRRESWQENIFGKLQKEFVNFDIDGNVLSSSEIEKKQKYKEEKEQEQFIKNAFGVKGENETVNCAYCNQKLIKRNGVTIRSAICEKTSIVCLDKLGNPCEWTFCNANCSNNFQCTKCADNRYYRKNCR